MRSPVDGMRHGLAQAHVGPRRHLVVEGDEHHLDAAGLLNLHVLAVLEPAHELRRHVLGDLHFAVEQRGDALLGLAHLLQDHDVG